MKKHSGMFQPGKSGNINGRPVGSKNKSPASRMINALKKYSDDMGGFDVVQEIVEKAARQALDGDATAQRLILDKVMPSLKPVAIPVDLGKLPDDPKNKGEKILNQATTGALAADTARELLAGIASLVKIAESGEVLQRLEAIEKKLA